MRLAERRSRNCDTHFLSSDLEKEIDQFIEMAQRNIQIFAHDLELRHAEAYEHSLVSDIRVVVNKREQTYAHFLLLSRILEEQNWHSIVMSTCNITEEDSEVLLPFLLPLHGKFLLFAISFETTAPLTEAQKEVFKARHEVDNEIRFNGQRLNEYIKEHGLGILVYKDADTVGGSKMKSPSAATKTNVLPNWTETANKIFGLFTVNNMSYARLQ